MEFSKVGGQRLRKIVSPPILYTRPCPHRELSLNGAALEHDTARVDAFAGLARWSQSERASKAHDVTFPVGKMIGNAIEKAARWLGSEPHMARGAVSRVFRTRRERHCDCQDSGKLRQVFEQHGIYGRNSADCTPRKSF
jgi:hypothetical protein